MTDTAAEEKPKKLTRKDYASDQTVRWCPGCGDYAILAQMQSVMARIQADKKDIVFVSGIGCSSRFPYYMDTYGFHSIHGRAPSIATGIRLTNPDLQVWVVTGDGDALSIGGNHIIHTMRRNLDIKILLFNNQIYGLTKGQYSPTSTAGLKTKSSPKGSLAHPLNPLSIAIAAEATFVARTIDADPKHMQSVFQAAADHKGVAFVEILQNCPIFNDGAFDFVTDRKRRPENTLFLEEGKPLRYGVENENGIALKGLAPRIVENAGEDEDLLIHDPRQEEMTYAMLLSRFSHPKWPVPVGVFRQVQRETYDDVMRERIDSQRKGNKESLQDLLNGKNTWTVA